MAEKKDDPVNDDDKTSANAVNTEADSAAEDDTATSLQEPIVVDVEPAENDASDADEDTIPGDDADVVVEGTIVEDEAADTHEDTKPEPAAPPAPIQPQIIEKKASAVPLVIGGAVAAVLGFLAARADLLDAFLPPDWRMDAARINVSEDIDGLQAALTKANGRIAALEDEDTPEFDATDLNNAIAQLQERIDALENRPAPTGTSGGTDADYNAAFEALQAQAAAQQAEIEALLANARATEEASQAAADAALARSALAQVTAALQSGAPFADALEDLRAASVEVPAALSDVAADGVAQLSTLQAEIPDAARAALAAARATETDGGLGGFLKRQLGARSVAPREGDDPDAVLSRLEAAVREGRLDAALAEAEALPSEAQAAMQDWIDAAQARVDAQSATEALVQRVAAN